MTKFYIKKDIQNKSELKEDEYAIPLQDYMIMVMLSKKEDVKKSQD